MGNVDEEILKQRAAAEEFEKQRFSKETVEKENKQSIFDGEVLIHEIPVKFAERKLIEDKVAIWMPEDFEEFTPEEIAAVYLLGNKPDMVYGNDTINLSFGYHYTEHEVPNELMEEFLKVVKLILERSGPKVRIISEKVRKTERHTISKLEFLSHTIEDVIYNVMFFSSLEGKVLICFINFHNEFVERLKPVAQEMWESFRFLEEEKESEE